MTLWERILQGITAFSLDTIVSLVAGILTAKLVFDYLPPADYGRLALFLSFYATGLVFLSFGLSGVFTSEISRARGKGDLGWAKFLTSRYLLLLIITATTLLIIFVGIGLWQGAPALWSIMGTYLWLTAPNTAAYTLFHSATRFRRLAGLSITRSLSRLALLVTLPWWWSGQPLIGVALTYPLMELTALVASIVLAQVMRAELQDVSTVGYGYEDLLDVLREQGLYVTLSIPVKRIGDQLPVWFLKVIAGDVALGIYAAVEKAYLLVLAFFQSLETTLFPLVSEQIGVNTERLQVGLRQTQKYSFWLSVTIATVGAVATPWAIELIAGDQYREAIQPLRLMLWLLVLYAFIQSQRPLFYALKQQKWLLIIYAFEDGLYALLLFLGIRWASVTGAVIAQLMTVAAVVAARLYVLGKISPDLWVSPRSVFRLEGFDRKLMRMISQKVSTSWMSYKQRLNRW